MTVTDFSAIADTRRAIEIAQCVRGCATDAQFEQLTSNIAQALRGQREAMQAEIAAAEETARIWRRRCQEIESA